MPRILFCSLLLLLTACAQVRPAADPAKAWIDLYSIAGNQLSAQEVDGRQWNDARYFEVSPGKHRLQVRLQFEVSGGGGSGTENSGGGGSGTRTCILALDYDHFEAGQHYRLKAGTVSRRGWLRLYDRDGNLLSRGQQLRCGAF
ncbi:PA0061/PA0062 family lipoprotein [Pseudomonas sp. N040]|uniref:PA0061/PA0062 family lipoprotein n=1 Tax=Pseudomonas sp. N040 TaxID=2785325 RepID=UPI0018A25959|nr:hypothetical protein [Pseudomonas sp. N040]MBF7728842.1 hypothetical protein [Pseudomonas sp. N040]MBW7012482.1 hypothetical protein [Pseudomonas sp. N040]